MTIGIAVLLAIGAAVLFAIAAVLQHRAAHSIARLVAPSAARTGRRTAGHLTSSRTWIAGAVVTLVGFGVHASALHLGSLAVVQPLMTLTLPVSIVLGAARERRSTDRGDWVGVGLMCAGVAAFLAVTASAPGTERSRAVLFTACLVSIALAGLLGLVGRGLPGAPRAAAWGSSAALAFGVTAALTKAATADLAEHGPIGLLGSWPFWGLIVCAIGGVAIEQAAFSVGALAAVMVPVTLLNPIAACVLGELAWHQHLNGPAGLLGLAVAMGLGLATAGVAVLSRSDLLQPAPTRVR